MTQNKDETILVQGRADEPCGEDGVSQHLFFREMRTSTTVPAQLNTNVYKTGEPIITNA